VDLHGLKASLLARASAQGISPSDLVRRILADALNQPGGSLCQPGTHSTPCRGDRARLCLRMSADEAANTLAGAHRAGLTPGRFVAGVPVVQGGGRLADHLAALVASSAEMSTLNRNVGSLTRLLRQGDVAAALVYRDLLDTLSADVRRHLALAAGTLAELRPQRQPSRFGPSPRR
jgi:hypothetical protein